ncbi:hypothetical protein GCM10023178_06680 [Actinomadura luteofluorescens]
MSLMVLNAGALRVTAVMLLRAAKMSPHEIGELTGHSSESCLAAPERRGAQPTGGLGGLSRGASQRLDEGVAGTRKRVGYRRFSHDQLAAALPSRSRPNRNRPLRPLVATN